jgi:ArsR family transcriptional regulator, arsenate/arsenite/antimonite-responsive transcriptional repressor / arsenate reductase (thioredoxin)
MYRARVAATVAASPPPFLRVAGHPLRWRLLGELAHSDRQVTELVRLTGRPQSLVSYHLGRLRADGLVSARRSSADGREAYYTLDVARCGALLSAAGHALHPGLRLAPAPAPRRASSRRASSRTRVLFLCTGNSARSQMAEALANRLGAGAVEAFSAGSHPKPLHPNAVRVMRRRGIDLRGARSKHVDELAGRRFGCVVTLCDRVREVCPDFPSAPERVHWSIADPAAEGGDDAATYPAFERTAAELEARIPYLLDLIQEERT